MDTYTITREFERMGARLKVNTVRHRRREQPVNTLQLDIATDRKGEYFDLQVPLGGFADLHVTDNVPRLRHLLITAGRRATGGNRQKFLCGHDERHWFIAGIPDNSKATRVLDAIEALKPEEVVVAQSRAGLKRKQRLARKNAAFIRQGEWFFIPCPKFHFPHESVLRREPLSRGNGSKPHIVDEVFRRHGEQVFVSSIAPTGFTIKQYNEWLARNPKSPIGWQAMMRNAEVYARGCVRHADHATIKLPFWHRVVMNTENQSTAMSHVVFLD